MSYRCIKCPNCGNELKEVPRHSKFLSDEQYDSVKAGDWFCDMCKDDSTKTGYRYFKDDEVAIIGLENAVEKLRGCEMKQGVGRGDNENYGPLRKRIHDLRENSEDFPEKNHIVLCLVILSDGYSSVTLTGWRDGGKWRFTDRLMDIANVTVILWQELPEWNE